MRKSWIILAMAVLFTSPAWGQEKEQERLEECGDVIKEILDVPDAIPQELLDKAECIVVFPSVKKAALGIGGSYLDCDIRCLSRTYRQDRVHRLIASSGRSKGVGSGSDAGEQERSV